MLLIIHCPLLLVLLLQLSLSIRIHTTTTTVKKFKQPSLLPTSTQNNLNLHGSKANQLQMTIDPITPTDSTPSTIRTIRVQSTLHSLSARYVSLEKALTQTKQLFASLHNDLAGAGEWATEGVNFSQTSEELVYKGRDHFSQSKKLAKNAFSCASKCAKQEFIGVEEEEDLCEECSGGDDAAAGDTSVTLDSLIGSQVQQLSSSHASFVQAKVAIEVALQKLLINDKNIGDIIKMAKKSASSICIEIEKWISILVAITKNIPIDKISNNVKSTRKAIQNNELNVIKKTKLVIKQRKQQLRDSSVLRGVSEEQRKESEASRAHLQLERDKPPDHSQCEQLNHCNDKLWSKSEMMKDGCIHGCSENIRRKALPPPDGNGSQCPILCLDEITKVLGNEIDQADYDDFLMGCKTSCDGSKVKKQVPPKVVLWRNDQLGDAVVVPHGGTFTTGNAFHRGDAVDTRIDEVVPLKRGHGFRCNETKKWKPCFQTCNGVHSHGKSVKRR
jgi:hypothetical protein